MEAINARAYQYLLGFLGHNVKVEALKVWGKWLRAELNTGVTFMVRNTDID